MNTADFIVTTQRVLRFAELTQREIDIYANVLTYLSKHFEISKAFSIHFYNREYILEKHSTANCHTATVICSSPNGGIEVTVCEHYGKDKPNLYALYSKAFPKDLDITYYEDAYNFESLKKSAHTHILSSLTLGGNPVVKYTDDKIKGERYAIYIANANVATAASLATMAGPASAGLEVDADADAAFTSFFGG